MFLEGPKFLGWSSFHQVLCSYPKKRSLRQYGLLFSEVSVGFQKKSHHLETAARVTKVWVGMLGSLGESFVLGSAATFVSPPSSGPDTCLQKKLFKTMNDKQITVFIAIKRRPNFSTINYSFNLCCSLKAKSILQVSKIYKGGQLLDFECGHD